MMEPYVIVIFLLMAVKSNQSSMETLDDVLVYAVEEPSRIQKREASRESDNFRQFIEDKLIQHTQALEHLVKMARSNEELTKKLIESLSRNVVEPKMPEKVEVYHQNRRSNNEIFEDVENPIMRIGRNIPKYGNLLKDVIFKEIKSDTDPTPLVELDPVSVEPQFMSRRSFGGSPETLPSLQSDSEISPWCSVAILCRRTINPVCGYDDNFGFGKFDGICHMLQVNCYWKYNFALVPSCKPTS